MVDHPSCTTDGADTQHWRAPGKSEKGEHGKVWEDVRQLAEKWGKGSEQLALSLTVTFNMVLPYAPSLKGFLRMIWDPASEARTVVIFLASLHSCGSLPMPHPPPLPAPDRILRF